MKYTKNENKVMLGCRIAPDLKEALQEEADDLGLTLSNYTEQILDNRPSPYDEEEDSDNEDYEDEKDDDGEEEETEYFGWTEEEIDELWQERDRLHLESLKLKESLEKAEKRLNEAKSELQEIQQYHNPHNPTRYLDQVQKLHELYPDYTAAQIIELCVMTAVDAENAVMLKSTIGTVLQDYPNFFE